MDVKGMWLFLNWLLIGGGLTHYELGNAKYMRLVYGEGLRVPKTSFRAWDRETYFY